MTIWSVLKLPKIAWPSPFIKVNLNNDTLKPRFYYRHRHKRKDKSKFNDPSENENRHKNKHIKLLFEGSEFKRAK